MKIKEITEMQMAGQYKIVKTGPEGTTLQSPDMHTMLTLDPEAAKGIVANPDNPNEFTLSQQAAMGVNPQQAQQPMGPKQGATVEVPANETQNDDDNEDSDAKEIGGDPTDDFIDDVTDKEFEKVNRPGVGNRSPVAEERLKTELDKMLTIAGLR